MSETNAIRLTLPRPYGNALKASSNSVNSPKTPPTIKVRTFANAAMHKQLSAKRPTPESRISADILSKKSIREVNEMLYYNDAPSSLNQTHANINKQLEARRQYNYLRPSLPLGSKLDRLLPTDGIAKLRYSCEFFGSKMTRRVAKLLSCTQSGQALDLKHFNYLLYRYMTEITVAINGYTGSVRDATAPMFEMFPQNTTDIKPVDIQLEETKIQQRPELFFKHCPADSPNWYLLDGEQTLSSQSRNQIREVSLSVLLFHSVLTAQLAVLDSRNQVFKAFTKEFKDLEEQNYILKDVLNQFMKGKGTADIVIKRLVQNPIIHLYKSPLAVGTEQPTLLCNQGTSTTHDWIKKRLVDVDSDRERYHSRLWKGSLERLSSDGGDPSCPSQDGYGATNHNVCMTELNELAVNAWTPFESALRISEDPDVNTVGISAVTETAEVATLTSLQSTSVGIQVELISVSQQLATKQALLKQIADLQLQAEQEVQRYRLVESKLENQLDEEKARYATECKKSETELNCSKEEARALAIKCNCQELELEELRSQLKELKLDAERQKAQFAALQQSLTDKEEEVRAAKAERNEIVRLEESKRLVLEVERNSLSNRVGTLERLAKGQVKTLVESKQNKDVEERLKFETERLKSENATLTSKLERALADKEASTTLLNEARATNEADSLSRYSEVAELRRIIELLMRFPDVSIGDRLGLMLNSAVANGELRKTDEQVCQILHANNLRISLLEWKNHELRQWRLKMVDLAKPAADWHKFTPEGKNVSKSVSLWESSKVLPNSSLTDALRLNHATLSEQADNSDYKPKGYINCQNLALLSAQAQHHNHIVNSRNPSVEKVSLGNVSSKSKLLVLPQHVLTASLVRKAVSESCIDTRALESNQTYDAHAKETRDLRNPFQISSLQYKYAVTEAFKEVKRGMQSQPQKHTL